MVRTKKIVEGNSGKENIGRKWIRPGPTLKFDCGLCSTQWEQNGQAFSFLQKSPQNHYPVPGEFNSLFVNRTPHIKVYETLLASI